MVIIPAKKCILSPTVNKYILLGKYNGIKNKIYNLKFHPKVVIADVLSPVNIVKSIKS